MSVVRRALATLGFFSSISAVGNCALICNAVGATVLPHHATYQVRLGRSSIESEISGLKGRMEIHLEGSCDGWKLNQYLGFTMSGMGKRSLEHLAHLQGWETTNGKDYWFNTKTIEDRKLVEEISGSAKRQSDGQGKVKYSKPETQDKLLPSGTIFPMRLVEDILAAAERGERRLIRTVFDGSSLDTPNEISAFISDPVKGNFETLQAHTTWPIRMAYYSIGAIGPTPEFEMSVNLYDNGVAGDMEYDYGTFTMEVKLVDLEMLAPLVCSKP